MVQGNCIMNYTSVKETANLWKISERRVQKLCETNRIEGAIQFGGAWAIPNYAKKPIDKRKECENKYTDIRIEQSLFGKQMKILTKSKECTVFSVENETGNGVITQYNVFSGIEVFYNDFHLSKGFQHKGNLSRDIIEINHCLEGRCECTLKDGQLVYIGKNDFALNSMSNQSQESFFPLSHYHGILIIIHIQKASKVMRSISADLGGLDINLEILQEKLAKKHFIMRASESIQHIFSELYHSPEKFRKSYLSLKIVELLLFLSVADLEWNTEDHPYLYIAQANLIKEIKTYIIDNIAEKITIEMLSVKFNIPTTTLKNNFKAVYGTPISAYIRKYKMQMAAELLINTTYSVLEISQLVGYENQTNFAIAFQKIYGITPSKHRKIPVQKEDFLSGR